MNKASSKHVPPILLTGCARSGTSMTAGIFNMCGAWGGEMSGPTRYNRKGMFENSVIRNTVVKPYLRRMGVDPMGQAPLPDINNLLPFPSLRQEILDIIYTQGYRGGPWMYKGAKMCLIWKVWHEAFPEAKWVIVRRPDEGIINSCMKTGFMRNRTTPAEWQEWVDEHKKRFAEMHEAGLDVVEIMPHKFISGELDELQAVVEGLGLTWDRKVIDDFIEPQLWSKSK